MHLVAKKVKQVCLRNHNIVCGAEYFHRGSSDVSYSEFNYASPGSLSYHTDVVFLLLYVEAYASTIKQKRYLFDSTHGIGIQRQVEFCIETLYAFWKMGRRPL